MTEETKISGAERVLRASNIIQKFNKLNDELDNNTVAEYLSSVHTRDAILVFASQMEPQKRKQLSRFLFEVLVDLEENNYEDHKTLAQVAVTSAAIAWYQVGSDTASEENNEVGVSIYQGLLEVAERLDPDNGLARLFRHCINNNVPERVFVDSVKALSITDVIEQADKFNN